MPNTLDLTIVAKSGFDLAGFFGDVQDGLFSTSGAGTEATGTALFSMDGSTMDFSLDYVTLNGKLHVTAITILDQDATTLVAGTFATPENIGWPVWTDMRPLKLFDRLLGQTKFDTEGGDGDDTALGGEFRDSLVMKAGNDMAAGGGGQDFVQGGRGLDLLMGGAADDRLQGDGDHDLIICGTGKDFVLAGSGNDVVIVDDGTATVRGGTGRDLIVIDSFSSQAGGSPNVLRSTLKDFDPAQDALIFAGVASQAGTNPEGYTTLADVETGARPGFKWFETTNGTVIRSGDARVLIKGVEAEEIDLDYLLFTERTARETADLFDPASGDSTIGSGFGGDAFIAFGSEGTGFIAFGEEATGATDSWDLYSGDVLGFNSSAGGSPNV